MQGGFNASYNVPQGLPLVTHGHTFRLSTGDSSPKKAVSGSDSELQQHQQQLDGMLMTGIGTLSMS